MQAFHRNDPAFQLRGDLPKVGIRPAIDGRRKGIREGLEAQTMGMAKAVAALIESELKHPCGGCGVRGEVFAGKRGAHRDGYALLVLRLGDAGHGPPAPEGDLGLQRHGAAGRGVLGLGPGRAQPEGAPRLLPLQP